MVPKRVLLIAGLIVLFSASLTVYYLPRRPNAQKAGFDIVAGVVAPFQKAAASVVRFAAGIRDHYFFLISTAKKNEELKRKLDQALEENHRLTEVELSNQRLRELLNFKEDLPEQVVAAEVVGRDPSPLFQTVIIDKGTDAGVAKTFPVVVATGIVGQVIEVSEHYSKVLLITDRDSAVDALVQRSRARGLIKGDDKGECVFQYLLRKDDVGVGDIVVSSGMDGVFPKGLRVGRVSEVIRRNAGLFQEVTIKSFVDFEQLEEVLVVLKNSGEESGGGI